MQMTQLKLKTLSIAIILAYISVGIIAPAILPVGLLFIGVILLKPFIASIFDRIALGVSLLLCLNITLGIIFWALNFDFSPQIIYLSHGITALMLASYFWYKKNAYAPNLIFTTPTLDRSGLISLITSAGILLVLVIPLLTKYDTNYIYQYFIFGGDNTAHLEFTNAVDSNEGYVYEDVRETKDVITTNSTAYPQGLALNMYVAREYLGTLVALDTPKRVLYVFVIMSALLYALLSYVWMRIALVLASKIGQSGWEVHLLTILLTAVAFLGGFLHFHTNGFQTHIVSLILFGQILFLGTSLLGASLRANMFLIYASFLLNIGIAFTWLFLSPVALSISGILFLKAFGKNIFTRKIGPLVTFIKHRYILIFAIIAAIAACFIQVYLQLAYGIKNDSINEPGYIIHPEQSLIILGAVLPIIVYVATNRYSSAKTESPFYALLVFSILSALFTAAIYTYQIATEGRPEYYYFKTAYHLILLGTVSAPTLVLLLARSTNGRVSRSVIGLAVVLTLVIGILTMPRHLTPVVNGAVSNISPELANAYGNAVNSDPQSANNIISIGSCNRQQDFVITKLSGILGDDNTYLRQRLAFSIISNERDLPKLITEYSQALKNDNERLIILNNGVKALPEDASADVGAIISAVNQPAVQPEPLLCPHRYTGEREPKKDDFRVPF